MGEEADRFTKIAYLHLSNAKTNAQVMAILLERGATADEADRAIDMARSHLAELGSHRNGELLKTVVGGLTLIVVGWLLATFAVDAPGRFRGISTTAMLLGAGILGYGIWARLQKR